MKQFFFFVAMLISVATSATVTVTPMSVNYATKQVTFKVEWSGTPAPANNRVWVWVDLCPVIGTSPSTFKKAVISEPTGSGVVDGTLNGRGFYVNINGATITAKLDNADGKFNWCAYGSDFPPNAIETSGTYTLKGSPPFIITTSAGTVQENSKTFSGGTITALTDATGCPGVLCGNQGENPGILACCAQGLTICDGVCSATCAPTLNDACNENEITHVGNNGTVDCGPWCQLQATGFRYYQWKRQCLMWCNCICHRCN
jgi:hypothetical protein